MTSVPPQDVLLGKLTRREFRERMQSDQLKACIIPVAAVEQHLEHLAMEHDWRSVMHVATEVAERLRPQVIVTPAMQIGISEHHMRHIGTLSALPGGWLSVLYDAIRSMHHAGFTNILVLNGHGGNIAPCQGVWDQFLQRTEINLQFRSYWDVVRPEEVERHLQTGRFPGHAQEFETAVALALFPANVRADAMAEQEDNEPLSATADTGHVLMDIVIERLTSLVSEMIDGTHVATIPPFLP